MVSAVKAILLVLAFFGSVAFAHNFGGVSHISGFQGEWAVGPAYAFNSRHAVEFTVGTYFIDEGRHHQINTGYTYSPFFIDAWKGAVWTPIQSGMFLLYSLDGGRYFAKSPDQYPTDNYYEQTALRIGIPLGTSARFLRHRLELSLYTMILDSGIVALFNNDHEAVEYFLSSGASARFYF